MKKTTKFLKLFLFSFFIATSAMASGNYVMRQVIVLNEGKPGVPVTVGTYDPITKIYSNFDTIPAGFATDVIIDNGFIYVAADSILRKYDLITKQILYTKVVKGIRELTIWNNQILVTRGDIAPLPSYLQVYNKSDLSFVYEVAGIAGAASEVKTIGDTAYVGVNGFGTMGKLAVIDLQNHTLNREIDLGANGLNPEAVRAENGKIYAISSPNWTNSAVTKYDVNTATPQTMVLNASTSCSAASMYNSNIYFQLSSENKLKVFSVLASNVWDSLATNQNAYGLGIDSVNARIYAGVTDFSTYGKVYVYDFYGAVKDSFDVNISPGTFAFDVVNTTGVVETTSAVPELSLFPNPADESIHYSLMGLNDSQMMEVTLLDVTGREIVKMKSLSNHQGSMQISGITSGIYFLKVKTDDGMLTKKFVKN